ncbi:MAG: Fur family transcriptional regulator [Crocosphaera sp.]|nr:Fur family transcriptional regulator [Crocosphaera sp.]
MKNEANKIVNALKAKKLRVTPQRFAVYANLLSRTDHPTAEEILRDLNENTPTSSQATVYSSLQALRKAGLLREVLLEPGICRYDANIEPHHHFRCRCCGVIKDLPWETFASVNLEGLPPGIKAERYEVIVEGVCDRCE